MSRLARFFVISVVIGALVAASTVLVAPQARSVLTAGEADEHVLDLDPLSQRSVVFGTDGSVIAVLHAEENRSPIPLEQVPDHFVDMVLAMEDEEFYAHDGLNLRATLRALLANVTTGEVRQGGSTVTQQLVKNALLTPEQDLNRKIKEAVLAVRLEQQMSKREILERYLNTVYFGNGAYGVQAAAETYFGVAAGDLDVAESALLIGIVRNPVGNDPIANPDVARRRRGLVLDRAVAEEVVTEEKAEQARRAPLPDERIQTLPAPDDYFVEEVKQRLLADPRLGQTPQERYNAVFRGGLRIHTTLDPHHQRLAERAVREQLPDTGGEFTAALVALHTNSGAVTAMVGGPGFEQAKYNLVTQGLRQPGSSFKPFVLATAIEQGHSIRSSINATGPCTFSGDHVGPEPWRVQNYGGSRGGVVSLATATHRSLNCGYARLGLVVGLNEVVETARALGIENHLDPFPAMSLGAEEVRPIDMAAAYAAFGNDGTYNEPYFIERVTDADGTVLLEEEPESRRAIGVQTARFVTEVLRGVVQFGTGTRARLPGREAAGKTGTTQNWEDAWFVGYTPQVSAAVWMGSPVGKVSMNNVGGVRVTGGSYPARIWGEFMRTLLDGAPVLDFPDPDWSQLPRATYLRAPGESPRPPRRRSRPRVTQPPATAAPTTTAPPPTTTTAPPPDDDGGDGGGGDGNGNGDGGGNGNGDGGGNGSGDGGSGDGGSGDGSDDDGGTGSAGDSDTTTTTVSDSDEATGEG